MAPNVPHVHACARRKMSMYWLHVRSVGGIGTSKPHVHVPHIMVDRCATWFDDIRVLRRVTGSNVAPCQYSRCAGAHAQHAKVPFFCNMKDPSYIYTDTAGTEHGDRAPYLARRYKCTRGPSCTSEIQRYYNGVGPHISAAHGMRRRSTP